MKKRAIVLALLVLLALAGMIGWQVGACYLANSEFQSDMRDLAVQNSFRSGMAPPPTEESLRESVLKSAKDHGIELDPQQVTVECSLTPDELTVSLTADYEVQLNLLGYSLPLHFTPSSYHSAKVVK